jgi:hypothetical protein
VVGLGLLDGIEVLPLDVLDNGHLDHVGIRDLLHHDRHGGEAGQPRGAQTPFPGHQFVSVFVFAHHQRLNHALGADGIRQFLELFLLESTRGW